MTDLVWLAHDHALCEAVCARLQTPVQGAVAPSWHGVRWPQALQRWTPQSLWPNPPRPQVWILQPGPCSEARQATLALLKALCRCDPPVWSLVLQPAHADATGDWWQAGADRVLPHSAEPPLLAAMVRALLRRVQGAAASQTEIGALRFDRQSATLFHGQQRVLLTARETQLAALFFERGQQAVRTQEILRHLAALNPHGQILVHVPLYVHRLNRKLRPYGLELACLRGYGYRLHDLRAAAASQAAAAPAKPGAWSGAAGGPNLLAGWPPHGSPARA